MHTLEILRIAADAIAVIGVAFAAWFSHQSYHAATACQAQQAEIELDAAITQVALMHRGIGTHEGALQARKLLCRDSEVKLQERYGAGYEQELIQRFDARVKAK